MAWIWNGILWIWEFQYDFFEVAISLHNSPVNGLSDMPLTSFLYTLLSMADTISLYRLVFLQLGCLLIFVSPLVVYFVSHDGISMVVLSLFSDGATVMYCYQSPQVLWYSLKTSYTIRLALILYAEYHCKSPLDLNDQLVLVFNVMKEYYKISLLPTVDLHFWIILTKTMWAIILVSANLTWCAWQLTLYAGFFLSRGRYTITCWSNWRWW